MLRIAIPNKGTLSGPASAMLREAGYRQRADDRDLLCRDTANDVEFFYLRPRDIATYVASGDLDLGITGRDLLVDSGIGAEEILDLDFGGATFRFAGRPGDLGNATPEDLAGRRIATAYPGVVQRHLDDAGVSASVIRLDGAVENAIRLGVADVIADVVSTGATLRQAGLEAVGKPLLESTAVLVQRSGREASAPVTQLLRRLQGVLVARRYVMLAYDVPADRLDARGGAHSGHRVADDLAAAPRGLGGRAGHGAAQRGASDHGRALRGRCARAILVTDIHACRL